MVLSAWLEAYLDGRWCIFDPRNNTPTIGRVLIAQGRDAAVVPLSNAYAPNTLKSFKVWTDEVRAPSRR
jgi:transglutaminase-like putative cysteine protease